MDKNLAFEHMVQNSADLAELRGKYERLLKQNRKLQKQLSNIKDQFQIAVEHWEMYEDQFVDVEREACEKARQTLEALE